MDTRVKICGIMSQDSIEVLNQMKPEYVGFVFAKSKRKVSMEQAAEIAKLLSPDIQTVGVFVNEAVEKVDEIRRTVGLDVVQLHGNESPEYLERLGGRLWKALPGSKDSSEKIADYRGLAEMILLDAMTDKNPGGNNMTLDWVSIGELVSVDRLVLAGGLNRNNVRQAIDVLHPAVVDVSSGVETDGKKDNKKIIQFIEEVRHES
jgi:phosphoribosylanthranilate isomerase